MIFSPFSSLLISIGPFACAQYSILLFYVTQDYASLLLRTVYNGIIEKQLPASLCKRSQKWSIYPPIRLAQFTRTLSPNGFFLSVLSGDFLLYLRWLHQLTLRCNKFSSFFFFIANGLTMTMMINGVCVWFNNNGGDSSSSFLSCSGFSSFYYFVGNHFFYWISCISSRALIFPLARSKH